MAQSIKNASTAATIEPHGVERNSATNRSVDPFETELTALVPFLRAFSRGLCRKEDLAEDLAQEALAKAWCARDRFEPGTNLKAWLFTILRHEYYSHKRRAWRQMAWDEQLGEQIPAAEGQQLWAMHLSDCVRAFGQLPDRQREALLLVGAGGFSQEEAANVLGTAAGSLKSRTARGRSALAEFLQGDRQLPQRSTARAAAGMDDILAQLTAVVLAGTNNASHV